MVKPFSGKAQIKETLNGFKIEIPAPRNWFVIIFMTAWLGGWVMGWGFAFTSLFSGFNKPGGVNFFLMFWLVGWTVGGVFVIKTLVWMVFGKEIIHIGHGKLEISRTGDLLNSKKLYDLKEAKSFEVQKSTAFNYLDKSTHVNPFNASSIGTMQFDYGLKTIRFGIGIDEAEGKFILDKFKTKGLI